MSNLINDISRFIAPRLKDQVEPILNTLGLTIPQAILLFFGQSGMKWKEIGAGLVLSLRTLVLTHSRWEPILGKNVALWVLSSGLIFTSDGGHTRSKRSFE